MVFLPTHSALEIILKIQKKNNLVNLLRIHLDLFDHWQPQTGRPFETLKRFFKIYIKGFDGAKEARELLMQCKSTDEARKIIDSL